MDDWIWEANGEANVVLDSLLWQLSQPVSRFSKVPVGLGLKPPIQVSSQ